MAEAEQAQDAFFASHKDVSEWVPLVETETPFGGRRQWFECVSCRSRCRILYGGGRFRCRRCHRLRYETQYEPGFARAATRALNSGSASATRAGSTIHSPQSPSTCAGRPMKSSRRNTYRLNQAWAVGIMARFRS